MRGDKTNLPEEEYMNLQKSDERYGEDDGATVNMRSPMDSRS